MLALHYRNLSLLFLGLTLASARCWAQETLYAGAVAGFAILSADASSNLQQNSGAVSSYDPKNGAALNLFAGSHFSEYLSFQGNYNWNRNPFTLSAARFGTEPAEFFAQSRTSNQHALILDLLLYFRDRDSWARPYLSTGVGWTRLNSRAEGEELSSGTLPLPAEGFSSDFAALRVAVGLDVRVRGSWYARYSFSESISSNPISDQMTPPGDRAFKNFQNLFGLYKTF